MRWCAASARRTRRLRPPVADASAATEAEGAAEEEIGPRRVQTFAVRPDGTIVRTDATAATPDPAGDQQQQLAAQTEQIEPVPVATVAIGDPSQAADVQAPALRPTEAAPIEQAGAALDGRSG